MIKLKLKKAQRGLYHTDFNGLYIDFYKMPTDGYWRSSFFQEEVDVKHKDFNRAFSTLKIAKLCCELHLTKRDAA